MDRGVIEELATHNSENMSSGPAMRQNWGVWRSGWAGILAVHGIEHESCLRLDKADYK